ncbi:MAG: DUF4129 domain-containing protein [Chloroflexota bacterium]
MTAPSAYTFEKIQIQPWRELSVLSLLIMELSWVVPWYRALTPATYASSPLRVFLVLGVLWLSTYGLVKGMSYLRLRVQVRRWVLAVWVVIAMFISFRVLLYAHTSDTFSAWMLRPFRALSDLVTLIPDELLVAVVVLVTCWRGMSLAQERVGPSMVRQSFFLGVIVFIAFIFLNTLATGETPGGLLYLFLFAGLMAMGTARLASLGRLRGGREMLFNRRWFLGLLLAVLVVIGLAAVAAGVMVGEEGAGLSQLPVIIGVVVALLVGVVLSPLMFLLLVIAFWVVERMVSVPSMPVLEDVLDQVRGLLEGISNWLARSGVGDLVNHLARYLKPVLLFSVILLFGLFIVLQIRLRIWRQKGASDEEVESLLSQSNWLELIRLALQRQWQQMLAEWGRVVGASFGSRRLAAARIRRIYIQLMRLASELSYPRPAHQTPLEFLPTLEKLFPRYKMDVGLITQAYIRVRYGELPESQQEVEAVEAAWERVKEAAEGDKQQRHYR